MKQTGRWNRALAWLCVVVMIVMMLPMSGFTIGETEEEQPVISETYVPEETVDEAPVDAAPAEEQADPEAPAEEAAAEIAELAEEVPMLMLDGADPTEDEVKVVMGANSGLEIDGNGIINAVDGQSVTIKLDGDHSAHYSLPPLASLATKIRVGDAGYEGTYSYVQDTGVLTFDTGLSAYGGKTITIDVSAVEDQYHPVEFSLTGIKDITSITKVYVGDDFTCTLEAEDNFTLPTEISITVGGTTIASEDYTYDSANGQITISADKLTANDGTLKITATATENPYYTVSLAAESKGIGTIDTKAYAEKEFKYTLKAEKYYTLPTEVNIAIGGTSAETLAVDENGQISISADKLPAPTTDKTIVITGTATATQYDVTVTTKGKTTAIAKDSTGIKIAETNGNTLSFKATHFSAYTVEFDAGSDKKMPETISVTGAVNYSYSRRNKSEGWWKFESIDYDRLGELKLPINSVCGDVEVSFNEEPEENLKGQYNVLVSSGDDSVKCNIKDVEEKAKNGTDFNTTLEAENGYTLPAELSVRIKDKDDPLDASLVTWDNTTGMLKVAGKVTTDAGTESESTSTVITGSVFIVASATLNNSNYTVTNADETAQSSGIYKWSEQAVVIEPKAPATAIQVDSTWYKGIVIGTNYDKNIYPEATYYNVLDCNSETIAFKLGDGTWEGASYTAAKTSESKELTFSVDTTAPVVTAGTPSGTSNATVIEDKYYTNNKATVIFTVVETNFVPSVTSGNQDTAKDNFTITCAADYTFTWTDNRTCVVTLTATGANDGEYTVKLDVTDIAGNKGDATSKTIVLDKTAPEVSAGVPTGTSNATAIEDKYYTNNTATVTFTVVETNFVPSVTSGNQDTAKDNFTITCAADYTFTWTDNRTCVVTLTATGANDGEYTVKLEVEDRATNKGDATSKTIVLDKTAPVITASVPVVKVQNTSLDTSHCAYEDKYYTNNTATVTFTVVETNFVPSVTSGNQDTAKDNFTITCAADYTFTWTDNRTCVVTLTATGANDGEYTVKLEVEDRATNKGDATSKTIVLDKTAPVITASVPVVKVQNTSLDTSHCAYEDKYYTNNTATVTFTVVETNFVPSVTSGNQDTAKDNFTITCAADYTFTWTDNRTCVVTLTATGANDGEYTVKLEVEDRATNKGDATSKTIVLDKTPSEISDVFYSYTGSDDGFNKLLDTIKYWIFGNKHATDGKILGHVTIKDSLSPIYLDSITIGGIYSKNLEYYEVTTKNGGKTAELEFTVPVDFKDQVTIEVQDMATNIGINSKNGQNMPKTDDNDFQNNYLLDKVAPVITFNNPDYTTIHSSNYTLSITITDPKTDNVYSGLDNVTYEICKYDTLADASAKNENYSLLADGVLYSKGTSGEYYQVRDASVTLQASYNSNLIFVRVIATDNAANQSVETRTDCFKMDNTAPYISVVYDNNDALNSKYFKANRTATVTVVDNNFSSDLVEITTGGSILSWSAGSDIGGKDGVTAGDGVVDTYTCQISYTADNDYKLSMTTKDLGGNSTADSAVTYTGTATQDFTLDKTNPVYTVEFLSNNETIENDGYSQGETTVLLSVSEHNFDTSSATSGLTVTKDGVDISADIRSALSWASTGDTRTASFVLTEDGDYVVTMSFIDMAGNNSTDAGEFKLHVDQHDPIVKITGVKNKSANNAENIAPVVTISDKYYNEAGVTITMANGKGEKVVVYNSSVSKLTGAWLTKSGIGTITRDDDLDTSSQVFTFENIDTDDIYSLVVTMTDLSGRTNSVMTVLNDKNKEEELSLEKNGKMLFSVNRNGSTYTVDDDTMSALNQYVQSIGDVHIMEINVDELDPETIHLTLTHDNNSRDLENGKDYSYQQPPEQNESGWNVYEYILDKSLFEEDGVYTVTVYSVDAAGNISQNNTAEKDFEITFIVDKTAPIFVAMNLEAGEIYNEESRVVTLNCSDNIALDTVHVYLLDSTAEKDADGNYIWYETDAAGNVKWNAEELTVTQDGDNYSFELKEGTSAATSKQSVLVVCTDKAGNQNEEQEILNFTISSSLWIRYYANKPLFYGSIGGIVALLIVAGFIIFRNKDEESKKKSASHLR